MSTTIIGAGLAGLMAGSIFQRAQIFEAGPEDQANHKAVLRFRSSAVGDTLGIDFRKVTVHKGIYHDNRFVQPTVQLANYYSKKVIGRLYDRSIWKTEPVERFIAPEDLIAQLVERCNERIKWSHPIHCINKEEINISTAPLPVMAKMLGVDTKDHEFKAAPIEVRRWRVPDCDVFQTIYFPSPEINLYRASITGNLLIAEYVDKGGKIEGSSDLFEAFGFYEDECELLDAARQSYGKIAPINDAWRRDFILRASSRHNVYSLGRYATWRPSVLLDDVLKDIYVIKKLIGGDGYARSMHAAA